MQLIYHWLGKQNSDIYLCFPEIRFSCPLRYSTSASSQRLNYTEQSFIREKQGFLCGMKTMLVFIVGKGQ